MTTDNIKQKEKKITIVGVHILHAYLPYFYEITNSETATKQVDTIECAFLYLQ